LINIGLLAEADFHHKFFIVNAIHKSMVTIKFINFGIAYQYDNTIEINRVLLNYPKQFKRVLQHELEHLKRSEKGALSHWKLDFLDGIKYSKEDFLLAVRHPIFSLQSMLPCWFQKGEFHYNTLAIAMSLFGLLLITTSVYFIV